MKKFSLVFLAVCLLLTFAFPAFALTEENKGKKVFVKVDGQGSDSVGGVLIYQVKELIRNSKKFTLIDLKDDSKEDVFVIEILTLKGDENSNSTIYSVNWLRKFQNVPYPVKFYHIVGICGIKKVEEVAEGIVATTDETFDEHFR